MSDRGNKSEAFQTPHQQQEENAAIWQPPPQQSSLHGTSNWRPTDRHRSAYTHVYTPTSRPALELPPDEDVHNQGVQLSKGRQAWNLLEDGPCREASAPLSSDTISAERGVPKERVNRHAGDLPQVETEPKPNKQMCKRTLGRRVTFNMRCQEIEQQKTFTLPTRYPTGRNVIIRLGKSHGPLKGILKKPRPIGEVNIPHGESLMRFRPNRLRSDFPPIVYRASRPAGTYKAPKWCEYPPDPTHSGLPMAIVQGSYREMDVIFDPSHDDELLWCNKEYNPCYIHEFEANERKKPYPHNKQPVVQVEYKQAPTSTKIVATRMPIVVPIDEMRRIGAIEELTKREDIFPWEKAIPTDIQKHVVDVSFRGNVSSPLDQQLEDCAHGYIETADDPAPLKAVVTPYGVVSIFLRDRMRVDITTDFAIRIVNPAQNISLALCPHGSSVGLVHPKGRVWQYGTMLEMATNNTEGINHYAKSFREGISFMSDKSPIVYTLTDDGVDQGKDWFTDLGFDFIKYVFYHASRHGGSSIISGRATRMLKRSQYFKRHGEDHWLFHKLHIVQMADGNVSVYREQDSYRLVTSPRTGCASINTPTLKCTASLGTSQHLVALIADHKLFFDGQKTFTLSRGSRSVSYKPDAYFEFHNDPNQKRRRRQKKRNLPANPQ